MAEPNLRNLLTRTKTSTNACVFIHGSGSSGNVIQGNRIISEVGKTGGVQIRGIYVGSDFTNDASHLIRFNWISGPLERYILALRNADVVANIIDSRSGETNNICISDGTGATVNCYGNTMVVDGTTIYGTSCVATMLMSSNIVYATAGNSFYVTTSGTMTADRNCYFGSGRAAAWDSLTFANWQLVPQDLNGFVADPLFESLDTFHLQSSSPCKGAGDTTSFRDRLLSWSLNEIKYVTSLPVSVGAFR